VGRNIRYVITHVQHGRRVLSSPAQGRYTHLSRDAAHDRLLDILRNNDAERLRATFGEDPQFEVREVECWNSGDPKRTVFSRDEYGTEAERALGVE